jgi:hypothetical protein
MAGTGPLETLAKTDLDALLEDLRARYRPGTLEALSARDPEWRAAVDRVEREVGGLYEALREADATVGRWRVAVIELSRLWGRLEDVPPEYLQEVA